MKQMRISTVSKCYFISCWHCPLFRNVQSRQLIEKLIHIDRTVRLEKQILPRIFYNYLVTAKISRSLFRSCTIFEVYLLILCDFLKFNFSYFTPQVRLFFVVKRKPKIFRFKNAMERGIRIKNFSLS